MLENIAKENSKIRSEQIIELVKKVTSGAVRAEEIIPELRKMKEKQTETGGDPILTFATEIANEFRGSDPAGMVSYQLSRIISALL